MSGQIDTKELNKLLEKLQNPPKKRIKGFAKWLTYFIIIATFLLGAIGSFEMVPLDMEAFTSFIPMFASLFIPLVLSIGINSAFEKHEKAEVEKEMIKCGQKNG